MLLIKVINSRLHLILFIVHILNASAFLELGANFIDSLDFLNDNGLVWDDSWLWFWRADRYYNLIGSVWHNLVNWQWSLPQNTNGTPEASFVHTDETESFESHRGGIVIQIGIHKLVGRNPFSVSTGVLPHV